jgi:hypothetical protein
MTNSLIRAVRGNLVAWLALFVALGGTSLAASHFMITSTKQIKPSVIKKLKGNRGATGPKGNQGPQGAQGAKGATGTVDTSQFFSKTESDGRYLGRGAQAADSAKLGGVAASGYTSGEGTQGGRWLEMTNKGKEPNFLFVPQIGEIGLECLTEPTKAIAVQLTQHAGGPVFLIWGSYPEKQATKTESSTLQEDGSSLAQAFGPTENGTGQMIIQASSVFTSTHAYATITVSAAVTEGKCRFQANYTVALQQF